MMKRIFILFVLMGMAWLFGFSAGSSQLMAYTGEGQKTLMLKSGNEGSGTEAMGVQSLRFAEEMPFNEIAILKRRNIESVKSHFRRAVAALQKQVTSHE